MEACGARPLRRIAWIEPARLPYGYDDQTIYTGVRLPRAGPKMAALLRSLGYEAEVLSGETTRLDPDELAEEFDLACISVLSNTAPHGMILGRWLSQRGLPVVMGGYQFAHNADTPEALRPTEQALDFVPYVVRGEGYAALPDLLAALARGGSLDGVGGLSYRDEQGRTLHNPKQPLLSREAISALPPQDWSAVRDRDKMKVLAVHGMQGCPRECSWCAVWARDGRANRNTDPERFVDELEQSLQQGHFRHVFFSADNFPARPSWARQVCDEIVRRGLRLGWTCQAEVGAVRHRELVKAMIAAGCQCWCLGLESINAASLDESHKHQSRETMEQCIRDLHQQGVQVHGMFIVGLPHDTVESVRETVEWARRMNLETCQFLCLIDLPGSQDYERYNLAERAFRPFRGAYEALNWMFVSGHYARLRNEAMSYLDVQKASIEGMLRFYTLGRTLRPFLTPSLAHFRAARERGRGLWSSLGMAYVNNVATGLLRLRGRVNMHRWVRSDFNRTYCELLEAAPERLDALRSRLLSHLPPSWLRTLEEVHAERQTRLSRTAGVTGD